MSFNILHMNCLFVKLQNTLNLKHFNNKQFIQSFIVFFLVLRSLRLQCLGCLHTKRLLLFKYTEIMKICSLSFQKVRNGQVTEPPILHILIEYLKTEVLSPWQAPCNWKLSHLLSLRGINWDDSNKEGIQTSKCKGNNIFTTFLGWCHQDSQFCTLALQFRCSS